MKRIVFILYFTLASLSIFANPIPKFLLQLMKEKKDITYILNRPQKLLPDSLVPPNFNLNIHTLFKNKLGLLISIEGTGWLYQIISNNGQMEFKRLDSTFFVGYNFADLRFSFKGLPHSFGGYGFWKSNGILRRYTASTKDWKAILLNKEVSTTFSEHISIVQFDTVEDHIVFFNPISDNDAITNQEIDNEDVRNTVWSLDYTNGIWKNLGKGEKQQLFYWGNSPWGAFCAFKNNKTLALVDLKKNKIFSIKPSAFRNYYDKIGNTIPFAAYFSDSTLYFGDLEKDRLDSFQLQRSDFEDTGVDFYQSEFKLFNYWPWFFLILMPIGLYLFKRKQSSIAPDIPIDAKPSAASSNSTLENLEHFSGLELGLLKMFLQKHSIQEVIVIDDLNKFLGLHSKNESIQKKIRSESLNHLNEKLQLLCHLNEDAIVKTRSSFDKRSFEYQINPLFIEPIKRMGITYKE